MYQELKVRASIRDGWHDEFVDSCTRIDGVNCSCTMDPVVPTDNLASDCLVHFHNVEFPKSVLNFDLIKHRVFEIATTQKFGRLT